MTITAAVEERPLAASEAALAALGTPIVFSHRLRGRLDLNALNAAVDDLLDLHPVLSSRILPAGQHYVLRLDASLPRPRLSHAGDAGHLGTPHPLDTPVLQATVIEEAADRHTFVLSVHHAICDGISAMTLLETLWRSYTAHATGGTPLLPRRTIGLPRSVDEHFRDRFSDEELASFLADRASKLRGLSPACLPVHADPVTEPGAHIRPLRLTAEQTQQFARAARAAQVNRHALACGIVLRAVHSQTDTPDRTRTMTCYSTIDLRRRVRPPLPRHHLVLAACSQEAIVEVGPRDHPAVLGARIWDQLKAAAVDGTVEKSVAAVPQVLADMAAAPMSVIVSNLAAQTPSMHLPPGLVSDPVEGCAMPSVPVPSIFLSGKDTDTTPGLCITLNLARSWFTAQQADALAEAISDTVHSALRSSAIGAAGANVA